MISTETREKIISYLISNPIDRATPGCYSKVGDKFNLPGEKIRRIYRTLRERGLVEDIVNKSCTKNLDRSFKENVKSGNAEVIVFSKKRIKTLDDLIEACEIDTKEWEIVSWEANKWEVGRKDKSAEWKVKKGVVHKGKISDTGKIFVEPLFQVKAKLVKRKVATDLNKQKEEILKELKNYSPKSKLQVITDDEFILNKNNMLEISIPDLHIGKMSWSEETDENYDIKIAEKRVKEAVKDLLTRVNLKTVNRILLPVGNDLINTDNRQNTTFNGTPQDTDARYMKIVKLTKRILIEIIDDLSTIAPVDVVVVPGNHDTNTMFLLGEILEAFYHNNEYVNVDNSPKLRKYYNYGKVGIQLTHGDQEDHKSLGLIFATEQPDLWAKSRFRFSQLGHYHKNKKLNFVSVDEFQGYQVQILPSLSGIDFWHKSRGYNTLKQAKALLFNPNSGLIGEFTTTASL